MKKSLLAATLILLTTVISSPVVNATSLMDAYKDAIQNDPQVLRAKAQYDLIKEQENTAFSALLPQVTLSGSFNMSNGDQFIFANGEVVDVESDTLQYGLSLSQSIFRLDSWHNLHVAEKQALQAMATYDLVRQTLVLRVAEAYFGVLRAKDNLEFVQAEKKAIERQLEQTKQRFNVGLTAITDVHEAQANFDNSVATEIRANNDVEIAKEVLREITGKYYAQFDLLDTKRFEASRPSPALVKEWVNKSETANLELKAQELVVEAAKFSIKQAKAGHYPTLNLGASIGKQDQTINNNGLPILDSRSVNLTLNVPIYLGGSISSAVRQAQANYVLAGEDREQTYRAVVRQVRTSFADVTAFVSTIKALEQSVVSAESALNATQAGFEVGTRTIVDVLNSTQNLYRAKSSLASARYDYILAMLSLKQASGELTAEDVVAVSDGLIESAKK